MFGIAQIWTKQHFDCVLTITMESSAIVLICEKQGIIKQQDDEGHDSKECIWGICVLSHKIKIAARQGSIVQRHDRVAPAMIKEERPYHKILIPFKQEGLVHQK